VASECHGRIKGPDVLGEAGAEASPVHTVGLHCHMEYAMDPAFELFSTDPARLGDAMRCHVDFRAAIRAHIRLAACYKSDFPAYTAQQRSG